ncbi:hypothetical protein G8O24_19580 [Bradyrhizobium sp. INPA01-394B]|uniref:DUF3300 domain-containing protein n=1 Tax=Bradyrhizobium campsiandrae TaxID=1729892 RepID=A0ABR7UJ39_9BRAD|nr:hypothetical protein [Bradyrhizobium campsiandrae]MBC9879546.1 hypothetical protein [Bradyrhizobium campsiandrae]MBC9984113.1 hypothetical protein [Bradyrhizobium campsiandrae]
MKLKIGVVAASLFGALAASSTASAMPVAAAPQVSNVEQVRMVCNAWGRCWWQPNVYYGYGYGPGYYGPPRYYGPRYYGPRYYGYYGYRRW